MSRANFGVEKGLDIFDVDGLLLSSAIAGSAAPGGDAGPQDAAPIGSTYQRTDGNFYRKIANAGALADWDLMPPGLLSAGYAAANGTIAIGDTVEEAVEKIVGNQDDIQTASGLAQGAVDNGTFTGATIADNVTTKAALQAIETAYEETDQNVDDLITLSGVAENATDLGTFTGITIPDTSTNKAALQALETQLETISGGAQIDVANVTTLQDLDTVLADDIQQVEWEIVAFEEATPANKKASKIVAIHNGHAGADATLVDDTQFAKLKFGNFNLVLTVDLNGVGAAQAVRLRASSSTAGVHVSLRRTVVN